MGRVPATRTLENALRRAGFCYVAGVDEVGRGCLAGPVVAAAVVLDPRRHIPGVADSKAVPALEREAVAGDPLFGCFGNVNASKRVPQLTCAKTILRQVIDRSY